jgi:5-methyltetrahydrofolate--homocysteine methyltransferase
VVTVSAFLRALTAGPVLLMDGGTGSELIRAGLSPSGCAAAWNLSHPDTVLDLHRAYRRAGADCLLTNSFQLNPLALRRHGLLDALTEMGEASVRLARKAGARFVLASIGPIVNPPDMTEFTDRRQLRPVLAALDGVDGFLFETCSSPRTLGAVEYAFHELPETQGVPILLSLAYRRGKAGRLETFSGHPPETFARHAERHGVAALGVNCGLDIDMPESIEIVKRYRDVTDLPLFARPNAGSHGERMPEALAARLPELLAAGVRMVGGCCGTTPRHIEAFRQVLDDLRSSG